MLIIVVKFSATAASPPDDEIICRKAAIYIYLWMDAFSPHDNSTRLIQWPLAAAKSNHKLNHIVEVLTKIGTINSPSLYFDYD